MSKRQNTTLTESNLAVLIRALSNFPTDILDCGSKMGPRLGIIDIDQVVKREAGLDTWFFGLN